MPFRTDRMRGRQESSPLMWTTPVSQIGPHTWQAIKLAIDVHDASQSANPFLEARSANDAKAPAQLPGTGTWVEVAVITTKETRARRAIQQCPMRPARW